MREYDLIVVGGGSGNMIFGPEFDGWKSAIIEEDKFGGTCLHRGCVPSKMYVVAADVARTVRDAAHLDVRATYDGVDWANLRDRIFGRLDPTDERAVRYRERSGVDVLRSHTRFVAPKVLEVDGEQLTARHIVVAAGSRPYVPEIPGLDTVPFHTSDTIMRIDELPASLVIIGGGFVAAEMGHVFSSFGTDVTILQRSERLLMAEDVDVSTRFTELVRHRMHVETDVDRDRRRAFRAPACGSRGPTARDTRRRGTPRCSWSPPAVSPTTTASTRPPVGSPSTSTGTWWSTGSSARVSTACGRSATSRTTASSSTWRTRRCGSCATTCCTPTTCGRSVTTSCRTRCSRRRRWRRSGLTEVEARASDRDVVVASRAYSATAYGWALEDTTSFLKVIADAHDRTIVGAHVIGPDAVLLLQPLLQAMMLGQTADQVAHDVLYIHPALTEVVEQALLEL